MPKRTAWRETPKRRLNGLIDVPVNNMDAHLAQRQEFSPPLDTRSPDGWFSTQLRFPVLGGTIDRIRTYQHDREAGGTQSCIHGAIRRIATADHQQHGAVGKQPRREVLQIVEGQERRLSGRSQTPEDEAELPLAV